MNAQIEAEELQNWHTEKWNMAGVSTREDELRIGSASQGSEVSEAMTTPVATIYRYQKPIETVPLVRLYA